MKLKIKKLVSNAKLPVYSTPGAACMDVTCTSVEYDKKIDAYIFHTGLAFEIPKNHVMLIFPRSSNRKTDCYMPNSVGVLDSDYRGELIITFKERNGYFVENASNIFENILRTIRNNYTAIVDDVIINHYHTLSRYNQSNKILTKDITMKPTPYQIGDRIAQIMIIPIPYISIVVVDELSETDRGTGGFGSTGR